MKKALACAVVAIGLVLGSGGAAMAGETKGNGEKIDNNGKARSLCHYSGLDVRDAVEGNPPGRDDDWAGERGKLAMDGDPMTYHGVQSWGAFVQAGAGDELTAMGLHPGQACNPNTEFPE